LKEGEKESIMSKKIIIPGVIVILAISVIIGFIFIRKKSGLISNPWKVIPVDAAYIIRMNDYHSFTSSLCRDSKIWRNLSSISPFSTIEHNIQYIDSIAETNSKLFEFLRKSQVLISGHYIGGKKSNILITISFPTGQNEKNVIDLISIITNQNLRNKQRKYEGKSIFSVSAKGNETNQNYYISVFEGHLIISKSVILIENAIRQQSLSRSLLDDEDFAGVLSTSGKNKDANLFIDLRKFTGIASIIASDKFSPGLKKYKDFGGWTEFDINIVDYQTMLNGFLMSDASENMFIDIFNDIDPVKISSYQILPASVSTFVSFGIGNIKELNSNYQNYLIKIGRKKSRDNALNEFNNTYQVDLGKTFSEIIDNEITIAHGGYTERALNIPSQFVLIKCKSGSQAEKNMESLVKKICRKQGTDYQNMKHISSIDNDVSFKIIEFPIENFTGLLFGNFFELKGNSYLTFYGNYLIVSQSIDALQHFLYSNLLNKTLATNKAFKNFTNGLAQKTNFLFYTNLSRSSTFFEDYLNQNIIKGWEENFDIFQNIQALGFQITEVSNMCYGNIVVQHVDDYKGKPQTVWESLLDTSFAMKPYLVENHYTKQKEIFLQDLNNTIYLINKAGRILWKQKISEKIISEIFQIDYYKNGKLQLLFCTENYLHLIDRNGNYVERYPVRLREKASAGMALFDYENNKNYRIFIPCTDHLVYAYSKEGNLISGWSFTGSDYPIKSEIAHFRVFDKDYIVLTDKYRIWILDRRGSVRVKVNEMITKSEKNKFYMEASNTLESSRILTTDTSGNIVSVYFDGHVVTASIDECGSQHFFNFKDVDADGEKDYIFLDGNKLRVYKQNKSEIFSFDFPSAIVQRPIYFEFSATDRKLGLVDIEENKIYLLNNNGSIYKGFPLEGTTLFSIGNLDNTDSNFNLIVGGRNNFLYNYSVQ